MAIALTTRAWQLLTGDTHPAADARVPLGDGWEHVLTSLLARQPTA